MSKYRRSLLQAEILLQLDKESARTITELAERVNSQRPSVSRSLRVLKEQNLVYRDRKGWHLTDEGRDDALVAKENLVQMAEKVQSMADRTSAVWGRYLDLHGNELSRVQELIREAVQPASAELISSMIQPILENHQAKISKTAELAARMTESFSIRDNIFGNIVIPSLEVDRIKIVDAVDLVTKTAIFPDTREIFGDVLKPLLDVQELNRSFLIDFAGKMPRLGFEEIIGQNTMFLARAIDDVLSIRRTEIIQFPKLGINISDFSWISDQLVGVNQAFGQLYRHELAQIELSNLTIPSAPLVERMVLPSATVVSYTDSLRDLVEAEVNSDILPLPDRGFEEYGDQSLDPFLQGLGQDFVEMRYGTWGALSAGGPDRLRHAAVSQRELLTQILQNLVPNNQLPEGKRDGPQVKARVKILLGASKSDADFVETMSNAVLCYYGQLNKFTHHNKKHEESLRALLHAGEGLIRFILSKVEGEEK